MNKLKMQTPNLVDKNVEQIGKIFPEVITEIKDKDGNLIKGIDFDLLKQKLRDVLVEDENERYRLDWPGKKASLLKANTPITKTLRPVVEDSVNFETTENLYIEGDNFEVLKILQESYLGKVKMIYIDPPYNTGKDFIYKDDFKKSSDEYEEDLGLYDEEGGRLFRNTDSNGRYHSDWLSMMYERLVVARDLLKDDGVIFISIDDNEVENLKKICNEIFGEENFIGSFIRRTINSGKQDSTTMSVYHEYLYVYTKNIEKSYFNRRLKSEDERKKLYPLIDKHFKSRGRYYISQLDKSSIQYSDSLNYSITAPDGSEIFPGKGFEDKSSVFRWSKQKVKWGIENDYIVFKEQKNGWKVYAKSYEFRDNCDNIIIPSNPYTSLDYVSKEYSNFNSTPELQKIFNGRTFFDFPKPVIFICDIIKYSTTTNDIILDFFSGSSTTAHAVMQLNAEDGGNRKFIMVQLPEETDKDSEAYKAGYKTIADIGKERIRRAGKKIKEEFLDKYTKELEKINNQLAVGSLIENEELQEQKSELETKIEHIKNLDTGFRVYKTDSSNMKDVFYHPTEIKQELLSTFLSNIKEDRTPEDLLTQVILNLGLELSLPIEKREILGNTVFVVQENALVACFDDNIDFGIVNKIAELKPFKVVFKDASFKDDKDRFNVEERFKRLSPETVITVI